jgi:Dihaem cytochrome c
VLVALAVGCGPSIPEPDSPGAVVMRERCGGCHRVYAPQTMTLPMWTFQLARMRELYARQGIPWLTPSQEQALTAYLQKYAGAQ